MARCWPRRELWDVDYAKMKRKMVRGSSKSRGHPSTRTRRCWGCGDALTSAILPLSAGTDQAQVRHSTTKVSIVGSVHKSQRDRLHLSASLLSCLAHTHRFTQASRLPARTFSHRLNGLKHTACYSLDWGEPCTLTLPGQPASPRSPSRLTSPCLVDRAPRLYPPFPLLRVSPPPLLPVPLLRPRLQHRPVILWFTPLKTCQR
jgi:hypothetical protein